MHTIYALAAVTHGAWCEEPHLHNDSIKVPATSASASCKSPGEDQTAFQPSMGSCLVSFSLGPWISLPKHLHSWDTNQTFDSLMLLQNHVQVFPVWLHSGKASRLATARRSSGKRLCWDYLVRMSRDSSGDLPGLQEASRSVNY